jgi:ribA/ribD-fused uncharacterized protein
MTISFYDIHEVPYGVFSNFAPYGIELDGFWWPTTEHYFQAQKFSGTPHMEEVRLAPSPKEAAMRGRDRSRPLRLDWEQVKDDVMRRAVMRKFETHAALRNLLLATGEEEIIENTKDDYYWGCGRMGVGKICLVKS